MGRFTDLRNSVAELIGASRDEEPEPEGYAGDTRGGDTIEGGYLEHDPPKDIDDYWSIYKRVGPINSSIQNFASEVIEPGWYITADSDDTEQKLAEYMNNVAILNTETDVNASQLMERMIIEREVRGTVFLEKVTDSQGRNQALYPLQNDTITIYTKPGKNMLPAPDDDVAEQFDDRARTREETPRKENGDTAAYVQFDDTDPHWDASVEVKFTRDQVIKWVRDADIGDARGTSRIETIADRAEGLLRKLDNNDAAIESKAWPQIIFNMGTEENPWSKEEVKDFIDNYDDETLEPGTMVAVSGDVSTEEFAGETADIADDLRFDVNMIMSGMPGPVYATGGFSQNVAPAVAQAQERQFRKEVKKTRRELETLFTPYLKNVAGDYDLDAADSVELHLGRPAGQVAPEDVQGNIIQYNSNSPQGGGKGQSSNQTTSGSSGSDTPQPGDANQAGFSKSAGNAPFSRSTPPSQPAENKSGSVMAADLTHFDSAHAEELADPRLVSTTEQEQDISKIVSDVLLTARDEALRQFESQYEDAPVSGAAEFEGIAMRAARRALNEASIEFAVRDEMESVISDTISTMAQDNHPPQIDPNVGIRHRQQARSFAESVENQTKQAVDDMMDTISTQVRRAAQQGSTAEQVAERVEEQWNDTELENRADLIAHMEVQNAVNSIKLAEYDRHPEIVGYKIINSCGPNTTPLCRDLTTCGGGEAAVVRFDDDEDASDQLEAHTSDARLFEGFNPLPPVPPFHFGCQSEIVAVTGDAA